MYTETTLNAMSKSKQLSLFSFVSRSDDNSEDETSHEPEQVTASTVTATVDDIALTHEIIISKLFFGSLRHYF